MLDCIKIQNAIRATLTPFAQQDPFWGFRDRFGQQLNGSVLQGAQLYLKYLFDDLNPNNADHPLIKAKITEILMALLDRKLDYPLSPPYSDFNGLPDLAGLLYEPGRKIMNNPNLPPNQQDHIVLVGRNCTALIILFAEAEILKQIIAFQPDIVRFLKTNRDNPILNRFQHIQRLNTKWIKKQYGRLDTERLILPGIYEPFYNLPVESERESEHLLSTRYPSPFETHVAIGRLFYRYASASKNIYGVMGEYYRMAPVEPALLTPLSRHTLFSWLREALHFDKIGEQGDALFTQLRYVYAHPIRTINNRAPLRSMLSLTYRSCTLMGQCVLTPIYIGFLLLHGVTSIPFHLTRNMLIPLSLPKWVLYLSDIVEIYKDVLLIGIMAVISLSAITIELSTIIPVLLIPSTIIATTLLMGIAQSFTSTRALSEKLFHQYQKVNRVLFPATPPTSFLDISEQEVKKGAAPILITRQLRSHSTPVGLPNPEGSFTPRLARSPK